MNSANSGAREQGHGTPLFMPNQPQKGRYEASVFRSEIEPIGELLSRPQFANHLNHLFETEPSVESIILKDEGMLKNAVGRTIAEDMSGARACMTSMRYLRVPFRSVVNSEEPRESALLGCSVIHVTGQPDWKSPRVERISIGRWIADTVTNEYITVCSGNSLPGHCLVFYWSRLSTKRCHYKTLVVNRKRFETGARTRADALMASSVMMSSVRDVFHNCIVCDAPISQACMCQLPSYTVQGNADFRYMNTVRLEPTQAHGQVTVRFHPKSRDMAVRAVQRYTKGLDRYGFTAGTPSDLWRNHLTIRTTYMSDPAVGNDLARMGLSALLPQNMPSGRRERNRVAAARSNAKRKAQTEAIRRAHASITQQAAALERKRARLLEENTRLRQLVWLASRPIDTSKPK